MYCISVFENLLFGNAFKTSLKKTCMVITPDQFLPNRLKDLQIQVGW